MSKIGDYVRSEVKLGASGARAAQVASSETFSITTSASAANLRSTEEVNTETGLSTGISSANSSFEGASTSQATIGGSYDGSLGNDTVTFSVTKGGNVGGPYTEALGLLPADLEVEVRDGSGALIDTLSFSEETPVGEEMALSTGLAVSFSGGSLEVGDSFELGVSHSRAGSMIVDQPMNGRGGNDANFDLGQKVVDGAFQLNGVSIAVSASDTVKDVLDRISASAANATATFDSNADRIVLTYKEAGGAGDLVLGGDTSGFLAATKLQGAIQVDGVDNEYTSPIDGLAELSAIRSGNFFVEGREFSVDVSVDSLSDVIGSINNADLGVSATYTGNRVVFTADEARNSFSLLDGSSNFFAALGLEVGTFKPGETSGPTSGVSRSGGTAGKLRSSSESIEKRFSKLEEMFGEFFSQELFSQSAVGMRESLYSSFSTSVRNLLKESLGMSSTEVDQGNVDTGFGIVFNFNQSEGKPFLELKNSSVYEGVRADRSGVKAFLFGSFSAKEEDGFFAVLDKALASMQTGLMNATGVGAGFLLSTFA